VYVVHSIREKNNSSKQQSIAKRNTTTIIIQRIYTKKLFNKYSWLVNFDRYIETQKVKEMTFSQ
jgi:hypothetical protein